MSLGYFKIEAFSVSPVALQNYVKYTYLLENWVKNQTNTVVFLGQFPDVEISLKDYLSKQVVGWMSHYHNSDSVSYVSEREEALKLSMLHCPKPVYNITEIVKTVHITTSVAKPAESQIFLVVGIHQNKTIMKAMCYIYNLQLYDEINVLFIYI